MSKKIEPDIKELVKQASEIARQAPENLREAAFNKAFDLLASSTSTVSAGKKGTKKRRTSGGNSPKRARTKGPVGLITELAKDDFFKSKRMLPEIQKKLEENGHIYAQTSLSSAVLSLTKKKILRRLKGDKGWVYVRGSTHI